VDNYRDGASNAGENAVSARQRAVPAVPAVSVKALARKPTTAKKPVKKRKPKFDAGALPEYRIKRLVRARLKELGVYQFWPVQSAWGTTTLDILVCYRGSFVGLEIKRPGGEPTARQVLTMQAIEDAGGQVYVIDSIEKAKTFTPKTAMEMLRTRGPTCQ
jgi:hypothetical protein